MKDTVGAFIGALFPSGLGVFALIGWRLDWSDDFFYNTIANIVYNSAVFVVIVLVGFICACAGAAIQEWIRKKIKQWEGYKNGSKQGLAQHQQH